MRGSILLEGYGLVHGMTLCQAIVFLVNLVTF